jgi:hypothetical protein
MTDRDLPAANSDLAALIGERLGIRRGATLEAKLRHAGRLLPRAERAAGRRLVEAERLWPNPKLRRRIDVTTLDADIARLRAFLERIDPADRRRGVILGILATLAFNFLVLATAAIVYLAWSGRL